MTSAIMFSPPHCIQRTAHP